ncbi:MAG: YceI family protein [Bdellovibrionaceae bacterium]|nr:YceI family protein [Pseudobdellovibrionaceae bacterium]
MDFKSLLLVLLSSGFIFAETGVVVDCKISPVGKFQAKTKEVKGSVTLKNNEVQADKIIVDLKSLTTEMPLRDDHMKNKYLEVTKFPTAELIIGKGKDGKGDGKIKFRGIEKDIEGTYKLINNNKELEAKFELSLSKFKISGIRYLGAGVKDIVNVTVVVPVVAVAATKAQSPVAVKPPVKK